MQRDEILGMLFALIAFSAPIGFVVIRRIIRLRREKEASRKHIHDVVIEMGPLFEKYPHIATTIPNE